MRIRSAAKNHQPKLPNLIIIGAGKCGTTSLHYYLGLHPEISMSWEKELHFFVEERNWHRGIQWYQSNFRGHFNIHGEASPSYTNYPQYQDVAQRMHNTVPRAKLIYMVRDPVERIASMYINRVAEGKECRDITDVLSVLDDNIYIDTTRYFMQIEQYLRFFPDSSILVVSLEDLSQRRILTLQQIFGFLEVQDTFQSSAFFRVKHPSFRKRRKNQIGMLIKRLYESSVARTFPLDVRTNIGQFFAIPFSTRIERPVLGLSLRKKSLNTFVMTSTP
jgi:hypothetical protein